MRKKNALRELIVACAVENGGYVETRELRLAAAAAGFDPHDVAGVDRFALKLVDERVLHRAGKGRYGHTETVSRGNFDILARLPFGPHFYSRILRHMLTHRFVDAVEVRKALDAEGCAIVQQRVSNALGRLCRRGYVESVGTRKFTLAKKTLDLLHLSDVIAAPGECEPTVINRAKPHIIAQLRTEPPKRPRDIMQHLRSIGLEITLEQVRDTIRNLRKKEPIRRVGFGTYTMLPEPRVSSAS